MSTRNERTMMWRTTYVFGTFGLGLTLAYVGFLIGGDAQYSVVFRIFAASPLLLGACACVMTALRELREDKSNAHRKVPQARPVDSLPAARSSPSFHRSR